jgi:hypothetical protein
VRFIYSKSHSILTTHFPSRAVRLFQLAVRPSTTPSTKLTASTTLLVPIQRKTNLQLVGPNYTRGRVCVDPVDLVIVGEYPRRTTAGIWDELINFSLSALEIVCVTTISHHTKLSAVTTVLALVTSR